MFFCSVATGVAQDNPPIRSKQIKLPQVEEQPMWQTRNAFGQIKATYLDSTPTRVKLKMPRGDVQEIPMFYFGSPPIHYFLNKMAKIPETVTDHQMESGRRKLISLTAVTFFGDAPKAGKKVFEDATPTIYRKAEAKGWGDTIGGRPVKMITEKP